MLSRRDFARVLTLSAAGIALPASIPAVVLSADPTEADVEAAERLLGLSFRPEDRKAILREVKDGVKGYAKLREANLDQEHPATVFRPIEAGNVAGKSSVRLSPMRLKSPTDEELPWLSVAELGRLLRERRITSRRLTELSLARLERHDPTLLCVVTLLREKALRQADRADREIAEGRYRGPLHGIPYGVKDLFDTAGDRTTWGAAPYRDRVAKEDAAVVRKLEEAGAVLVAKLTLGALALGDVWFGGVTKNPWNLKEGSSGSSAGSCSAVAAGLVPFAIGTETLGSIASPSLRCRVTGLRPTFGRVARTGGMFLSPTMDKVGPIVRHVEDAALVFAAIHGADPGDPSAVNRPFIYRPRRDLMGVRIGSMGLKADDPMLLALKAKGATISTFVQPTLPDGVLTILDVECAASHDSLTRSEALRSLGDSPWPDTFRAARFVGAVEYLQAQKARRRLQVAWEAAFAEFDVLVGGGVTPSLVATNLTGHPQLCLPFGADEKGRSRGYGLVGRLYDEGRLLTVGRVAQEAFPFHRERPAGFA